MPTVLTFCHKRCKAAAFALRDPAAGNGFDLVAFVCKRHLADASASMLHTSRSGEVAIERTTDWHGRLVPIY